MNANFNLTDFKDAVQLIGLQIDDPKTFFNYALVCKKFAFVCKLISVTKMNQFALPGGKDNFAECPCCGIDTYRWFVLPNGNYHGPYRYHFAGDETETTKMYCNGNLFDTIVKNITEDSDTSYYTFTNN